MKKLVLNLLIVTLLFGNSVFAQQADTANSSATSQISQGSVASNESSQAERSVTMKVGMASSRRGDNDVVTVGGNSTLPLGKLAGNVVSVFGSSTTEGDVTGDVVSVLGNTRASGVVAGDVVAVLGNVYVDNQVGGEVVSVFGSVTLGPKADVSGQVVSIGGALVRDPAAVVRGSVQELGVGLPSVSFAWLHPWIQNCFMYGRPLALAPGLTWAWIVAALSLFSYVFTALFAPRTVERCVVTLEQHPGYSLLIALLATIATPILFVLLVFTVVGILVLPFLGLALMTIGFFGKLVLLAWIGKVIMKPVSGERGVHMALATLIGGLIVTVLYLVPVLGFITYKLLGFIGFGVVLYALLEHFKQRNADSALGQEHVHKSSAKSLGDDSTAHADASTSANTEAGADANESVANDAFTPNTSSMRHFSTADALTMPRADFWRRMLALCLDWILVLVALNVVYDAHNILLVSLAVYGAIMWKFKGTTIGGLLFNIRVVRRDGRDMDWTTAIVRALSCFLSLIVAGLGFIWIVFDDERQAWHDKIAGTVVVRVPKGASLV